MFNFWKMLGMGKKFDCEYVATKEELEALVKTCSAEAPSPPSVDSKKKKVVVKQKTVPKKKVAPRKKKVGAPKKAKK